MTYKLSAQQPLELRRATRLALLRNVCISALSGHGWGLNGKRIPQGTYQMFRFSVSPLTIVWRLSRKYAVGTF